MLCVLDAAYTALSHEECGCREQEQGQQKPWIQQNLATELKRSSNRKGLLQFVFECLYNSLNVPAEPVSSCPRAAKYQYRPTVGHGQGVRDIGERLSTSVSEVAQAQEATGEAGCV
jgi:hypothetical protein